MGRAVGVPRSGVETMRSTYRSFHDAKGYARSLGELKTLYNELRAILELEDDDEPDPDTNALYRELLARARQVTAISAS